MFYNSNHHLRFHFYINHVIDKVFLMTPIFYVAVLPWDLVQHTTWVILVSGIFNEIFTEVLVFLQNSPPINIADLRIDFHLEIESCA